MATVWEAVSAAGATFLRCTDWRKSVPAVLERTGRAAGATRASLVRNDDGFETFVCEWRAPLWREDETGCLYALRIPILAAGVEWGAVGFVSNIPSWSNGVERALQSLADLIGAAIERDTRCHSVPCDHYRYKLLVENLGEGVGYVDPNEVFTFANPAGETIFGVESGQLCGRSLLDFLSPDLRQLILRETGLRRRNLPSRYEHEIVRQDGSTRSLEVSATPQFDRDGRFMGTIAVFFDTTDRKRIEAELKRSEEEYAALFNSGNDAAFVFCLEQHGPPGSFVQVNDIACQRLGYTREELLQRSIRDLHTDDSLREFAAVYERLAAVGQCMFETEQLARNGRVIPTEINSRIIEYRGRRAVLAVARDITERRKAEAKLQFSERRSRRYVERSAAGFVRSTFDGEFLECNDATVSMLGYESQQDLKRCRSQQVYPNVLDRQVFLDLLKEQKVRNGYELSLQRKDGTVIWVLANLTLVTEEDGEAFVEGSLIDITERKRIEDELRTTASVVEASTDFVGFGSVDGTVLFVNQAGRRIVGLDDDVSVAGMPMVDYVVDEDRTDFLTGTLPKLMRDGRWEGETRFKHFGTGAPIPMWQSVFFITDRKSKRGIGLATICRDLTQRKREESELLAAKEAAEAATRTKGQFIANMSHEIRTPMNGVIGMTGLLLETGLTAKQREYTEIVRSSGESLLTIINDILDFSKVEAGKMELEILDFDLRDMLESATQLLWAQAQEKGLQLKCLIDPRTPVGLRGDSGRLRQVLLNLGGNAVKFTAKGEVIIRAQVDREDDRSAVLRFSVEDAGIGIPADRQEDIFLPFTQADGSTNRTYGGTGLGLTIARQLVGLLGGQIGVDSEPGIGSRFWFTAIFEKQSRESPSDDGNVRSLVVAQTQGGRQALGLRKRVGLILVAEDNIVNQRVALAILEKLGCRADAVANGKEALTSLRDVPYDLVLMDCQMPEMNGYEAATRIRRPGSGVLNPKVPIIALTANAMKADREKCIAAGMDDYIAKPFQTATLSSMLEKWLPPEAGGSPAEAAPPVGASPRAPAPKPAFIAVLDEAAPAERVMGDRDLARSIFGDHLQGIPRRQAALASHFIAGDAAGAPGLAHAVKGAAGTGATP